MLRIELFLAFGLGLEGDFADAPDFEELLEEDLAGAGEVAVFADLTAFDVAAAIAFEVEVEMVVFVLADEEASAGEGLAGSADDGAAHREGCWGGYLLGMTLAV